MSSILNSSKDVSVSGWLENERRKYVRLRTVFPVLLSAWRDDDSRKPVIQMQTFTRNIGRGGLGLDVPIITEENHEIFNERYNLKVQIEVPFQKAPVESFVEVRWKYQRTGAVKDQLYLGLSYTEPGQEIQEQLFRYAKEQSRKPYIWGAVFIILLLSIFYTYKNYETALIDLVDYEQKLYLTETKLHQIREERNQLRSRWKSFSRKTHYSEKKIKELENKLQNLNGSIEKAKIREQEVNSQIIYFKIRVQDLEQKLVQSTFPEQTNIKNKLAEISKQKLLSDKAINETLKILGALEAEMSATREDRDRLKKTLDEISGEKERMKKVIDRLHSLEEWGVYQVRLDNGSRITGQVLSESDQDIELKFSNGTMILKKNRIEGMTPLTLKSKMELSKRWDAEERAARVSARLQKERVKGMGSPSSANTESLQDQERPSIPVIDIKEGRLVVDGGLYFIKGMAYGIEYPNISGGMQSIEQIPKEILQMDFRMMREAGINTIRTYEPLNLELLDLAWSNGIRVIMNVCYPTDITDYDSRVHLDHHLENAVTTVKRFKNHPAILMWSLWNDAPWVWGINGDPVPLFGKNKVNQFLKEIYEAVKKVDPYHPVTASNVLGFKGSDLGFNFLDVLGFNAYIGGVDWYLKEDAIATLKELETIARETSKPVVILETGFSTFVEGLKQEDVLEAQIKMVGGTLAGITIFQWADGWDKAGSKDKLDYHMEEHWGVVTGYRQPKPGLDTLSKLFNAIPTGSKGYQKP